MYVPIFRDLDARSGRKLGTDTHIHTHMETTTVTIIIKIIRRGEAHIYNIIIIRMQNRSTLSTCAKSVIICNALCISKHVMESMRNIACRVGIN